MLHFVRAGAEEFFNLRKVILVDLTVMIFECLLKVPLHNGTFDQHRLLLLGQVEQSGFDDICFIRSIINLGPGRPKALGAIVSEL